MCSALAITLVFATFFSVATRVAPDVVVARDETSTLALAAAIAAMLTVVLVSSLLTLCPNLLLLLIPCGLIPCDANVQHQISSAAFGEGDDLVLAYICRIEILCLLQIRQCPVNLFLKKVQCGLAIVTEAHPVMNAWQRLAIRAQHCCWKEALHERDQGHCSGLNGTALSVFVAGEVAVLIAEVVRTRQADLQEDDVHAARVLRNGTIDDGLLGLVHLKEEVVGVIASKPCG
mgnify:CR=1 FL=1